MVFLDSSSGNAIVERRAPDVESSVLQTLPAAGAGVAVLYFSLAILNGATLTAPLNLILSLSAFVSALLSVGVVYWSESGRVPRRAAHAVTAALMVLILFNSVLHHALRLDAHQVAYILLAILGSGFFLMARHWFVGTILLILFSWATTLTMWPIAVPISYQVLAFFVAVGFSVLLHTVRATTHARIRELILADERSRRRLETALEEAGTARTIAENALAEAKRAIESVEESEKRLRAIISNVPIVLYATDAEGHMTLLEGKGLSALGMQAGDLIGRSALALLRKRPDAAGALESALRGQAAEAPLRVRERDFELFCSPLEKTGGLIGVAIDVTERKQAETRLKEQEERFRALIENSTDGLAIIGSDRKIVFQSDAAERILGYPMSERVGKDSLEMLHPDERKQMEAVFAKLISTPGQIVHVSTKARHRDGTYRTIEGVAQNLLADPRVGGIVLNYRDISARRDAQARLEASERRYRIMFENDLAGGYICDSDGLLLECNAAFREILGAEPDAELAGQDFRHFFPDSAAADRFFKLVEESGALKLHEHKLQRLDGTTLDVIQNAILTESTETGRRIFRGHILDYTQRKQLEEQLFQAQKMEAIGALAGGMAHDFNNLLTALAGHVELLAASLPPETLAMQELQDLRKSVSHGTQLTSQLLSFSRSEKTHTQVFGLHRLILETIEMLRPVIGSNVRMDVELSEPEMHVSADAGHAKSALVNLILNARDAMPDGGSLSIRTEVAAIHGENERSGLGLTSGEFVVLHVKDTGHGMDDETRKRAFEPFFTTKISGRGTGLGLSTVYGFAKQSGGTVRIDSTPGKGTAFQLYLPLAVPERTEIEDAGRQKSVAKASGRTILFVEDEESVQAVISHLLTNSGYTVLCAGSAEEALGIADREETKIDLLITDMIMPGMNGLQLAERLQPGRPDMRVLLISGFVNDARFDTTAARHGAQFLPKPFNYEELAEKVNELLSEKNERVPGRGLSKPKRRMRKKAGDAG